MRNVDETRRLSFSPSENRRWRKKGEGGAVVAATGLRDLVTVSGPRDRNRTHALHTQAAIEVLCGPGQNIFPHLRILGCAVLWILRHKCYYSPRASARCCAKIRSPLCRRHCRSGGGGVFFFVGTEGSSEENGFRIDPRELRGFWVISGPTVPSGFGWKSPF